MSALWCITDKNFFQLHPSLKSPVTGYTLQWQDAAEMYIPWGGGGQRGFLTRSEAESEMQILISEDEKFNASSKIVALKRGKKHHPRNRIYRVIPCEIHDAVFTPADPDAGFSWDD